jgi:hypothetical protein
VNKVINFGVTCDSFDTYSCDLETPTEMSHLKIKVTRINNKFPDRNFAACPLLAGLFCPVDVDNVEQRVNKDKVARGTLGNVIRVLQPLIAASISLHPQSDSCTRCVARATMSTATTDDSIRTPPGTSSLQTTCTLLKTNTGKLS